MESVEIPKPTMSGVMFLALAANPLFDNNDELRDWIAAMATLVEQQEQEHESELLTSLRDKLHWISTCSIAQAKLEQRNKQLAQVLRRAEKFIGELREDHIECFDNCELRALEKLKQEIERAKEAVPW